MKHCEGHVDEDEERVRTNQVNITPSVVPAVPTQKARVINNTTINAHQINNITIVVFNPNGTEYDDNMDKKLLKSIFPPDNTQLLPQLCSYADALMSKQVNQNVRKSYMTSAYSDVKTEEGWKTLPDAHVYPYISRDIAISANDRLYEYPHIGNPDIRERLVDIVSDMQQCKDLKDLARYMKTVAYQIDREVRANEKVLVRAVVT
jgi:hypothetical protein